VAIDASADLHHEEHEPMDILRQYEIAWKASGRSQNTLTLYTLWLRRIRIEFGELPVSLAQAREWVGMQIDAGTKSQTLHVGVRALKSFSRWYAEEFDEDDVLIKLKYPKLDESAPGPIASDEDLDSLLRPLKGRKDFRSLRDTALITLMRDSGIRRSEAARIKVTDVDLEAGVILLSKTKSYKTRVIPLSSAARVQIVRYLKVRELMRWSTLPALWISSNRPVALRSDSISAVFDRLSKDVGIHVSAHMLRRHFATEWARAGGTDDALMSIAGWASPAMPARYRAGLVTEVAHEQFGRIVNGRG
jgi:integrase/recombinase XerC